MEKIRVEGSKVFIETKELSITEFEKETNRYIDGLERQITALKKIIDNKKSMLNTIKEQK